MDYPVRQCASDVEFAEIWQDLKTFGEGGHERLELRADANGTYCPFTVSKHSVGFWGFIYKVLRLCGWKPEASRQATVAHAICHFLETNQNLLQACLLKECTGQSDASCHAILAKLARFNRLFPNKAQPVAQRWFALQQKTNAFALKPREDALAKSLNNVIHREHRKLEIEIKEQKMAWAKEVQDLSAQMEDASKKSAEDVAELARQGQAGKNVLIEEGRKKGKELAEQGQSYLGDHNKIEVVNVFNDQMVDKFWAQREKDAKTGDTLLLCREGDHIRIDSDTVKILCPASTLSGSAAYARKPSKTSKDEVGLDLSSFDVERIDARVKYVIELTKSYAAADVKLLIDWLYGLEPNTSLNLELLITLMVIADTFQLKDIHQDCQKRCVGLFRADPAFVCDAFISCFNNTSPDSKGGLEVPDRDLSVLRFLEAHIYRLEDQKNVFTDKQHLMFTQFEKNAYFAGLGWCYKFGIGVPRDDAKAVSYLQRDTCPMAKTELAYFYQQGMGVAQDSFGVLILLHEADSENFKPALYNLGEYYKNDWACALAFFKQAAKHGDARAQNILAEHYLKCGSRNEILDLLESAINQGHVQAKVNFGHLCEQGKFVPQDKNRALSLYEEASRKDNPLAHYRLYRYHIKDTAGDAEIKAMRFLKRAVDAGHPKAQYYMAEFWRKGRACGPENEKKAFELYLLAAKGGLGEARLKVAECYEKGIGVEQDTLKAKYYAERFAKVELTYFLPKGD